jgi:hypothetical protein
LQQFSNPTSTEVGTLFNEKADRLRQKGETMTYIILPILLILCLVLHSVPLQVHSQMTKLLPKEERERRFDVMQRHERELRQNPDVLGLLPTEEGITIITDRPQGMPKEIEGVPVKTIAPPPTLPPPPGAIVLKPNGAREELKAGEPCPEGFHEDSKYRWRFCVSWDNPEPIPSAIMTPPIFGVPYEEAEKIFERNLDRIHQIPGVSGLSLGGDGITIETDQPALVPNSIEGLPVRVTPPQMYEPLSHTGTSELPSLEGGVMIGNSFIANGMTEPAFSKGTMAGVVLSDGKPWGISAAHILARCVAPPPCQVCDSPNACTSTGTPATKLNQCPHYQGETIRRTPEGTISPVMGVVSRWTPHGGPTSDNMAFFIDSDQTEGNGSLSVSRKIEFQSTFTGLEAEPMKDDQVTFVGSKTHSFAGTVADTNFSKTRDLECLFPDGTFHTVSSSTISYFRISTSQGTPGDSGGIILDPQGRVLGITSIRQYNLVTGTTINIAGPRASKIRSVLGFDAWYGTQTINTTPLACSGPVQERGS